MARTGITAAERLQGIFETAASYKNARRDLSLAILERMALGYQRRDPRQLPAMVRSRMSTVLATIIRERIATGEFTATDPDGSASVVVALVADGQECRRTRARQAGTTGSKPVERHGAASSESLRRSSACRAACR